MKMIYADLSRCIACKACEVACEREHNGASRVFFTEIDKVGGVPLICRHCSPSPCAAVCPTEALTVDREGIVSFNAAACTGCSLCMFACPFGVIGFDAGAKTAAKCDLCRGRLDRGLSPACAVTCPTNTLSYREYDSFLRRIRRRGALKVMKAAMPAGR